MTEIVATYNYPVLLISVLVAIFSCFITIELAEKTKASTENNKKYWLLLSSITMGTGIWTMHFTGMLALETAVSLVYDGMTTISSMLIAIVASYLAFYFITFKQPGYPHLFLSAVLIGLGMTAMHHIGMRGMITDAHVAHNSFLIVFATLFAILISFLSFYVFSKVKHNYLYLYQLPIAILMGLAISGMHYIAMESILLYDGVQEHEHINQGWGFIITTDWLVFGLVGATIVLAGIMYTLSIKSKNIQLQIHHMAYHDSLTGLPNRYKMDEYVQTALIHCKDNDKKMAVVFLDLDHFKYINDTMGHDVGDLVLKQVTERLLSSVRKGDIVARQGGDEFIILLEEIQEQAVIEVAERILTSFTTPFIVNNKQLFTTPSIGISMYPNDGQDIETLTQHADKAMYLAKKRGKNNYQFYLYKDHIS